MNLFLDSNIWIRYFVSDDAEKFTSCRQLFQVIDQGVIRPYVSTIVLLEVYWVVTSVYKRSIDQARIYIETMLAMRGLVIVEKTDFLRAFMLHQHTHMKLADCLIATQLPSGVTLCTYDQEFRKIPRVSIIEPQEAVGKRTS